jgi:uncharacterized protein (TIGR03435 family)
MGLAGEPPAGQVASSVEAVWERLKPEAERSTLPARETVTRRFHFAVAAIVAIVTVAIGLYAAQRMGLLQPMLPVQSQSPAVSVNSERKPATIETVAESREPVDPSEPRQTLAPASAAMARHQSTDAGNGRFQSGGAAFPTITTHQIDSKYSQSTTAPLAFDVASIRLIPPPHPTGNGSWIATNGRFRAERGFLRGVIAWAYEVLPGQVEGGPDWVVREPYDFDARAGNAAAGPDQIRVMLRTLLADRFKLVVHHETEQAQVYTLTVAKSGSKLQVAHGGQPSYGNWTGPGQVTVSESPILGLINILSNLLDSPVLDQTGLTGLYNFNLEFTRPQDTRTRQADSPPDLFTALQEQLGLELHATKGPVEIFVIDHIERPSPN